MKVFTCTNFVGVWPVGTAAVIVAHNEEEARSLLMSELADRGLRQRGEPLKIERLKLSEAKCVILHDGDY